MRRRFSELPHVGIGPPVASMYEGEWPGTVQRDRAPIRVHAMVGVALPEIGGDRDVLWEDNPAAAGPSSGA